MVLPEGGFHSDPTVADLHEQAPLLAIRPYRPRPHSLCRPGVKKRGHPFPLLTPLIEGYLLLFFFLEDASILPVARIVSNTNIKLLLIQ